MITGEMAGSARTHRKRSFDKCAARIRFLIAGLTFPLLFAGVSVAVVHLAFIAMFIVIPAGLFMWGMRKARLNFLAPLFVAWGAALGWSGNYLLSPFDRDRMLYAIAGAIAGLAAYYCSRGALAVPTERA